MNKNNANSMWNCETASCPQVLKLVIIIVKSWNPRIVEKFGGKIYRPIVGKTVTVNKRDRAIFCFPEVFDDSTI
jgi:hypothetical protein